MRREAVPGGLLEASAFLGHFHQDRRGLEALAIFLGELLRALDEVFDAIGVDVLQGAALEGGEAPAEDRADVGVGDRLHDLFSVALGGLVGLGEHQAVHQVLLGQLLGQREGLGQARPQGFLAAGGIVVEALAGFLARTVKVLAHFLDHGSAGVLGRGLAFGDEVLAGLFEHVHGQ